MAAITPPTMDHCEDWLANPCDAVEINQVQPMRKAKAIYSELAVVGESAPGTCICAEAQRQAEGWESFRVEKREGFSWALIGGCWHREAGGDQLGGIFGFLGSWS